MSKKQGITLITLLSVLNITTVASAGVPPITTQPPQQQTAPTNSNAIAFGIQAGAIAGTAQACGQDITTFTTRVGEAINKLSLNNADKLMAITEFQKSLQQAQMTERNNHTIPCTQVMQDFNNLPLLRPDYEQTVIAQLNPMMTNNTTTSNQPATTNTTPKTQQSTTTPPNTTNNPPITLPQQLPPTSSPASTNQPITPSPALTTPPSNLSQPVYSNPTPTTPSSTTYPSTQQTTPITSPNANTYPMPQTSTENVGQNTTTSTGGQ